MKIVFSTCYMDARDARTFCRRILANYRKLKFKVNYSMLPDYEKVVESMTAEGDSYDVKVFANQELKHTNYLTIN